MTVLFSTSFAVDGGASENGMTNTPPNGLHEYNIPLAVSGGVAYPSSYGAGYGDCVVFPTQSNFGNDHYAKANIHIDSGGRTGAYTGVMVRVSPTTGSGWSIYDYSWYKFEMAGYSGGGVRCVKVENHVATDLWTGSYTLNANTTYEFYLEVQGNTLVGKINGTQLFSLTDYSLTTGKPGLTFYNETSATQTTVESFEAGDFSVSGPATWTTVTPASISVTATSGGFGGFGGGGGGGGTTPTTPVGVPGTRTTHLFVNLPSNGGLPLWDVARWDWDLWDAGSGQIDMWPYVRSGNVQFGPKRREEYNPSSATFTLTNPDGQFSPSNRAGIYYGQLVPWLSVFFGMYEYDEDGNSTWVPIFTGYVTDYQEGFNDKVDPVLTLTCTDGMGWLARNEPGEPLIGGLGYGETSGWRVSRILDYNGYAFAPAKRNINFLAQTQLGWTDLSANPADELRAVAEAEGCDIWVDADGVLQFPGRGVVDQLGDPFIFFTDSSVDEGDVMLFDIGEFDVNTFGIDETSPDEYRFEYSEFETKYDLLNYANYVVFGRQDADPPGALVDSESISRYGRKTYRKTDLQCINDFDVLTLANRWLAANSVPRWYVDYIVVQLHQDTTYWSLLSILGLGTAVTVERSPNPNYVIREDCYVDGYEINFDADTTWFMTIRLRPVVSFAEGL